MSACNMAVDETRLSDIFQLSFIFLTKVRLMLLPPPYCKHFNVAGLTFSKPHIEKRSTNKVCFNTPARARFSPRGPMGPVHF